MIRARSDPIRRQAWRETGVRPKNGRKEGFVMGKEGRTTDKATREFLKRRIP